MQSANAVPALSPPSLRELQVAEEATVDGLSCSDPARTRKDAMAVQGRSKEEEEGSWGFIPSSA